MSIYPRLISIKKECINFDMDDHNDNPNTQ